MWHWLFGGQESSCELASCHLKGGDVAVLIVLWLCFILPCAGQFSMTRWRVDDGLPQNEIRGLAQTPDGYLWIATLDGLARFDGVHFTTFNKANSLGINSNRMTGLCLGVDGDLWIPYERGGLLRFHQGRFHSYGESDGINAPVVSSILSDVAGHIWILSGGRMQAWNGMERFVDIPGLTTPRYGPELFFTTREYDGWPLVMLQVSTSFQVPCR